MKESTAAQEKDAPRPRGRPKSTSRLEEVLKCAAAMFSAKGYAAASLEDIAAQMGMTRAALYYYTSSKEDLLSKCYDWNYETYINRINAELGEGTGRELLTRFFLIHAEVVCNDFTRCFLSSDDHYLEPKQRKLTASRLQHVNEMVEGILRRGIEDGSLAPHDTHYGMLTLFGAFNSLHKLVRPRGPTPREMGEAVLQVVLQGFLPRI